jgi:hypothetical protein
LNAGAAEDGNKSHVQQDEEQEVLTKKNILVFKIKIIVNPDDLPKYILSH